MADIKSNLHLVEAQLKRLNSEVADQWNMFQESNKENKSVPLLIILFTINLLQYVSTVGETYRITPTVVIYVPRLDVN